ncbi:MAG: hypothetical protein AB8V06_04355 [Francisella endosymbiont of Hyalomma asiaticum]
MFVFLSSHSVGVAPSLALADPIRVDIDNVEFYGVEAQRVFEKDEVLSDMVKKTIDIILDKILYKVVITF